MRFEHIPADVERVLALIFSVGHDLHVVVLDAVERSHQEACQRDYESVLAVSSTFEDDELPEVCKLLRFIRIKEDHRIDELLERKQRVVVSLAKLYAKTVCRLVEVHVLPLEQRLDDILDQELPVFVYPFRVALGILDVVTDFFTYSLSHQLPPLRKVPGAPEFSKSTTSRSLFSGAHEPIH